MHASSDRRASPSGRLPAVFFGHGNPMNALDHNRYTEAWRSFGAGIPRPRAILVILGSLVHQRQRGDGHGSPAHDPRFLWVPSGTLRGRVPRAGDTRQDPP
jgi:hypothetical protein